MALYVDWSDLNGNDISYVTFNQEAYQFLTANAVWGRQRQRMLLSLKDSRMTYKIPIKPSPMFALMMIRLALERYFQA